MNENKTFIAKIRGFREKYLPYNEQMLRRLIYITMTIFMWLIIWSLVFKCSREDILVRNYSNLIVMTKKERILWDLIPFNYRGTDLYKYKQMLLTVLNLFVLAPLGVIFNYLFKRKNVLRDVAIVFGISFSIELIQFLTVLGNPATEDLITNVAGYFIGLLLFNLIFKRLSVKQSIWFFVSANVILLFAAGYSIVTTVRAFDTIIAIITKAI